MRSENVISVMCNGHWIMKDQKILNVDEVIHSIIFPAFFFFFPNNEFSETIEMGLDAFIYLWPKMFVC